MKALMTGRAGSVVWLLGGALALYAGLRAAGEDNRGISVVVLAACVAFAWAFVCTMALFAPVVRVLGDLKWPVISLVGVALAWLAVRPNAGLGTMLLLAGAVGGLALALGWRLLRG